MIKCRILQKLSALKTMINILNLKIRKGWSWMSAVQDILLLGSLLNNFSISEYHTKKLTSQKKDSWIIANLWYRKPNQVMMTGIYSGQIIAFNLRPSQKWSHIKRQIIFLECSSWVEKIIWREIWSKWLKNSLRNTNSSQDLFCYRPNMAIFVIVLWIKCKIKDPST